MEDLHGNLLLAVVLLLQLGVVDRDVLFKVALRELDLVVLALAVHAHERPVAHRDGDTEDNEDEQVRLKTATVDDGEDALCNPWDTNNEDGEVEVAEMAVALGEALYRGIFYGGDVGRLYGVVGHRDPRRTTLDLPAHTEANLCEYT